MSERPLCDKCGEPMLPDQMRYTIADRFDEEDRWVSGRHSTCQEKDLAEYEKMKEEMPNLLLDVEEKLKRLRRALK